MNFSEYVIDRDFYEWLKGIDPQASLLLEGPFWGRRALEPRPATHREEPTVEDAIEHPQEMGKMKSWICDAFVRAFSEIFKKEAIMRTVADLNQRYELSQKGQDFLTTHPMGKMVSGAIDKGTDAYNMGKSVIQHPATQMAGKVLQKADQYAGVTHFLKMWLVDLPDTVLDFLIAGISCVIGQCNKQALWTSFVNLVKTPICLAIMSAPKIALILGLGTTAITTGLFVSYAYYYIFRIAAWALKKVHNKWGKAFLSAVIAPVPPRFTH